MGRSPDKPVPSEQLYEAVWVHLGHRKGDVVVGRVGHEHHGGGCPRIPGVRGV